MAVGALINDPTGLAWFVVASYLAGAAVAFLAGPDAAYITGETLHVNGGMYMP